MEFSAADLTNMRACQEAHMMDECKIQSVTQTEDSYNQLVESFTAGDAVECGLDMRPGSERHGVDKTVVNYDATLRLPIDETPDVKDRIEVTKRFGEALPASLVFNIVGPIQRGPSGIRLLLRKIET